LGVQLPLIPVPSWVDSGEALEDGGNTLVSGNVIRLTWNRLNGISTAVLISTLASAVFDNNDVTVDMASAYDGPGGPINDQMEAFFEDILENEQEYSFAISSVYVAGFSTGQANGNRITEGQYDVLFSLVVATIVRPGGQGLEDVTHAVSATANMLSHPVVLVKAADFTAPFQIVQNSNAVIFAQASVVYAVPATVAPTLGFGRQIHIVTL
jgi:hypothetical protein